MPVLQVPVGLVDRLLCRGVPRGCERAVVEGLAVILLPSCLCVCIAFVLLFNCQHCARISRQSVALSARQKDSGPQKSRPQLEASPLSTRHSPRSTLRSPLSTCHSRMEHSEVGQYCHLLDTCKYVHSHTRTVSVLTSCSHKKPFKQCV